MAPDAARRVPPYALLPVGLCGIDNLARHHPIAQDFLVMINVVNEQVQRVDALLETLLDPAPFGGRNNPRQNIEREDFFHSRLLPIHVEGDAHLQQRSFGCPLAIKDFVFRQGLQGVEQAARRCAWPCRRSEHFVEELADFVIVEAHKSTCTRPTDTQGRITTGDQAHPTPAPLKPSQSTPRYSSISLAIATAMTNRPTGLLHRTSLRNSDRSH